MNKTIMTTAVIISLVFTIAVNLWVDHQKIQTIAKLSAQVDSLQSLQPDSLNSRITEVEKTLAVQLKINENQIQINANQQKINADQIRINSNLLKTRGK